MIKTIETANKYHVNWSAKGADRVLQNVLNLLGLTRYEVSFNRTLGIAPDIVDKSSDEAAGLYTSEVIRIIESNEPRAAVEEITYLGTLQDGTVNIRVVLDIAD